MNRRIWILCTMVFLLVGCSFTNTSEPSNTTLIPPLTLEELKNFSYLAPQYNRIAVLSDGKFETGSGADYFMAFLEPQVAFGDLNADGTSDAAVLLAENGGGSGVFVSLIAVLNSSNGPTQVSSVFIDDRPLINNLTISEGKIVLDAVLHGPNDPMVDPTKKVTETFHLAKNGLNLDHFVSYAPDGSERGIHIDNPKSGETVSGSIQVQGGMPIGPFENTLAYRIYDQSGNKLAEGPFMVSSDGMGGETTFDAPIDISTLPGGIIITLQLVDVSMADGSTIALDSVELITK